MGSSCFMISCFIPGRTQDRLTIYIKQLVTHRRTTIFVFKSHKLISIENQGSMRATSTAFWNRFSTQFFIIQNPALGRESGSWIEYSALSWKGGKISRFQKREVWRSRGFIRNKKVASLLTSFRRGRLLHRHVAWEQNIRLRFPLNLNGERGDGMFLLLALNVIGVGQLPTKSRLRLPLFLNCWVKWLAFRADFSWVGLRRPSISIYWSRVDPPKS